MSRLDFLIQDCLEAYADEHIPSAINKPSSALSNRFINFSFLSLEQTLFLESMDLVSPVSPIDVTNQEAHIYFDCGDCSKSYPTKKQLQRHTLKHNIPNKYKCTVDGCENTSHRKDAMRSHIKKHERRIKRKQDSIYDYEIERQLF
jgi:hypothetical protein